MKLDIVFKDGREVVQTFTDSSSFEKLSKSLIPETTRKIMQEKFAEVDKHPEKEVPQAPTEGKPFEVNPLGMDRSRFENPRENDVQEWTRQIIQEAFAEVDKHPEKYASPFYTLIPEKKWHNNKTVAELKEYAKDLGGVMADWVEQALEWAQRISNGEIWEAICNNADTANCERMIIGKEGYAQFVGGSRHHYGSTPASHIFGYNHDYDDRFEIDDVVPLVVFKKK